MTGLAVAALPMVAPRHAEGAPTLRIQVDQKGDFALIGNTLGHDCSAGVPALMVGNVGACGNGTTDSAPDVFWRADSPAAGQAEANTGITVANARSTAVLQIPPGATVTHAFLYWGARTPLGSQADMSAILERPGVFSSNVDAIDSYTLPGTYYQSVADVTALVQGHGPGAYRVGGVSSNNLVDANTGTNFAGWWMVVFYEDLTVAPRNLALFDGLDQVDNNAPANATLSGFLVPLSGYTARLGVVTFEGDATIAGDGFSFDGAQLSDAANPAYDWFNGTRSLLGSPVSVVGDLPQLTGGAGSLSGMDMDIVDITAQVSPLQTSAPISATSTGDVYFLAGVITSISTFKPDFTSSNKVATDLNGGALLPGDVIHYTINVVNTGDDTSINTVLNDPLPAGVTYVPGSLSITSGANAGAKTDAPGDDQGEYITATNTVRVRLGNGANGTQGGTMAVGETTVVTFQVTVDANASGTISNQAIITAAGEQGASQDDTPTDGNGPAGGAPPTDVVIDQCATDADCAAPTPYCNVAGTPNTCVECTMDSQCSGLALTCDPATNECVCVPTGPEVCGDGADNNCNGLIGDGCADSDGDGLNDDFEVSLGTNPNDADTDDDGVPDGMEPSRSVDSDGDGLINAFDPDSDGDGLFDGTELGLDCSNPATDAGAGHCTPDADGGATITNPLDADSDDGGVPDGVEDQNQNGVIDTAETDPNNGSDDIQVVTCQADRDCGDPSSGVVCDDSLDTCTEGCRGENGNGCPSGSMCTSTDGAIGVCVPTGSGGAATPSASPQEPTNFYACTSSPVPLVPPYSPVLLLLTAVAALTGRRRQAP